MVTTEEVNEVNRAYHKTEDEIRLEAEAVEWRSIATAQAMKIEEARDAARIFFYWMKVELKAEERLAPYLARFPWLKEKE